MTESDLIVEVQGEIRSLSSNFVANDYAVAVDSAGRDTGFSLPTSDEFQIKWLKERTKRHLLFSLLVDNAESFQFKQISLQHVFKNFKDLIELMDKEFETALLENLTEFAGVDPWQMFGHKIDAGFAYEKGTGEDITYNSDQLVIVSPGD